MGRSDRVGRKMVHLGILSLSVLYLWIMGIISGEHFFLNMMSPIVFGKDGVFSGSEWMGQLTDGLLGIASPLWMTQKERLDIVEQSTCELYPTEPILSALYEENQMTPSKERIGEGDAGDGEGAFLPASAPAANDQGILYTAEMLRDYNYFLNQFYAVDSSTYADGLLDAETFMNMDLTMDITGDEPKILIYHTHSQEGFLDSRAGEWQDTVVGVGECLKSELEGRYGIATLHLTDTFDVIGGVTDRSAAYTYAEERIRQILEENPSIKVIIDLHRDGVPDDTRLVTSVNGKETAKLMLLNGLCRTTTGGPIEYLQNDYLTENLAFSFKLQAKAAQYYPDLMRRIYLRAYQYNLHMMPRSILVECGAQTNTVEEAMNAMPLLADLLYLVLSGS